MGVKLGLTLTEEHGLRVFENGVLRKIFGTKKDEATAEWMILHKVRVHKLWAYSKSIFRVIKSRRVRWAGYAARMGRGARHEDVWWGNPKKRENLKDVGVDGRTILKCIFKQ
jgi:hypothetical protein